MDSSAERRYVIDYSDFIQTFSTGTFSYKKSASIWWKLWSIYNITAVTFMIVGGVSYVITNNLSSKEMAYLSITVIAPVGTFIIQKFNYEFSENWNNLKKCLNEDFVGGLDISGDLRHNERLNKIERLFKKVFIRSIVCVNLGIAMIFIGFLWQRFQQQVDFHAEFNYLFFFYGIHRINNREIFLFVYLMQLISIMTTIFIASSIWLFIVLLAVEMSYMTTALEERMKSISQEVHRTVALVREYEMKTDAKKSPHLMKLAQQKSQNDRKICFQKFEENLKTCIRHHQTILRAGKLIRPLLNSFFTVNLAVLVLVLIATAFSFSSEKELKFDSHEARLFIAFSCALFQIGFQCLIAQYFQNMNDRIAEQVYSLPWYELSPPFRKIVYIFLCQAQAPIKFYAFNTFRITTFFFPTIANFVYTNTVNLLTIHNKYRRN